MPACRDLCEVGGMIGQRTTTSNKRVPPALTAFAPGNTARKARRIGTLGRYMKEAQGWGDEEWHEVAGTGWRRSCEVDSLGYPGLYRGNGVVYITSIL